MSKILVTGGSGFIGSHLIDELGRGGHQVTNFDVKPSEYGANTVLGDVTDRMAVENAVEGMDFVFHLAGMLGTHELIDNSYKAAQINIGGTINVLDACRKHGAKLIEISKPNVWLNTYSITKEAAEKFVEMYRREHGVKAATVKWFNVYGTRQPLFEEAGYRKAVPTWIVDGLKGNDIVIYGSGEQTMDLIHTKDTAEATISIMDNFDKCEGGTFEIGAEEITANEVAEIIRKATGGKSAIKHIEMRPGEVDNTKLRADISKLYELTGWKPRVSLSDGITECVIWYAEKYL